MAEHPEYQGAAHHLQGGNVYEIGSTGALRTFGNVFLGSSGSTGSTGKVTVTAVTIVKSDSYLSGASGALRSQVESVHSAQSTTKGSTSFTALARGGLSRLSSTGVAAGKSVGFRLPHPKAGLGKTIIAEKCSTAGLCVVETTALGVMFGSSASTGPNYHRLTFNDAYECVDLIGGSTKYWFVRSNTGSVALATNFTT